MRNIRRFVIVGVVCCAAASGAAFAAGPMLKEIEDAFVKLNEDVRPCVVNIDTKGSVTFEGFNMDQMEDLFRFFGMPNPRGNPSPEDRQKVRPRRMPIRQGTGSGFIYDKEGHIITNNHVVEGADTEILVRLWDGTEYNAQVVGRDKETDIAVLKIDAAGKDLPVAKLGDSSTLKVGQFAIALGSPRGFEGSLSFGHISALGRNQLDLPGLRFQDFIQTDAAINLGNSGGPLCNINGEVIGMNIAIVYGANSLGFAIPVNTAKAILPELIAKGSVTRGYLGVAIADARGFAEALGLPDGKGAFVKQVQPGTPAEKAEFQPYDVIRKVNGEVVEDADDLIRRISAQEPGAGCKVEIWRDGQAVEKQVELAQWEGPTVAEAPQDKQVLGLRVQALTPDVIERLGLEANVRGVIVADVEPGSAADDARISTGDVITEVAREIVANPGEFFAAVNKHGVPGKSILIGFLRNDGTKDITVIKVPKVPKEPVAEPQP